MYTGQMEMSFSRAEKAAAGRRERQNRAQWWFRRMRQIVDLASDWQPAPPPRPVQVWFPVSDSGRATNLKRRRSHSRSPLACRS